MFWYSKMQWMLACSRKITWSSLTSKQNLLHCQDSIYTSRSYGKYKTKIILALTFVLSCHICTCFYTWWGRSYSCIVRIPHHVPMGFRHVWTGTKKVGAHFERWPQKLTKTRFVHILKFAASRIGEEKKMHEGGSDVFQIQNFNSANDP